jgi:hypothetical protein
MKILSILLLLLPGTTLATTEFLTRIGHAYDLDDNDFLYVEKHYSIEYEEESYSWVRYEDENGKLIAGKTSDYTHHPHMPEFSFSNHQTGHIESVFLNQDKHLITFTKAHEKEPVSKTIPYSDNAIIDSGFDKYIQSEWEKLTNGAVMKKDLLIPSLMRYVRFRIYQSEVDITNDKKRRVFIVEPDGFFIRAVAGSTKLQYSYEKPNLLQYKGISNLRNDKGKNLRVVIKYENLDQEPI